MRENAKALRKRHSIVAVILLVITSGLLSSPIVAATVSHLYQAAVPVADQSASLRQSAIQEALKAVLVKVSGNAAIANVPSVHSQLNQAPALLQQYAYISPAQSAIDNQGLQLQAQFDPAGVNALLKQANQPLWPLERPRIGVWIALVDAGHRLILTNDNSLENPLSATSSLVKSNADKRGIPIFLPSQPIVEEQQITFANIYTLDTQTVMPVSTGLGSDGILMGRLIESEGHHWQANWAFTFANDHQEWQSSADNMNTLFADAFSHLTDMLTQRFAVLPDNTDNNSIVLKIDNVNNADDYARVIAYLNQQALISAVNVSNVNEETMTVQVTARGGEKALQQAFALGRVLSAEESDGDQSMRYRFIP
ncbi:MAG: hypothetical protein K0R12_769 [Gammaproteobacteria bacterium]|jgi:hypothetical protein|nr:hypothetical protein [Gammaproteobacteria bacterium]